MSKEDLSRGVSFWLTQKLKIQNSEMIRFLYFLVLALFGIISATELSATELALMEQMLAVCDIPFILPSPNPILMYNVGGYGSQSAIGIFTIFDISAVHQ